jgi:signal transduction histidine kinase
MTRLSATHHRVEYNDPDAPILIVGDPLRVEQVVENLLQNAIKYSPEGGQITVRIEQQGSQATLTISDQGIGIPEAAQAHLFERFYRASNLDPRRIQGVGLGLAVAHEIVALHGGAVEVASVEGQGSTFTVRLPLPEAHITAQSAQAIDSRQSIPSVAPADRMERPATKRYQEHVR